MKTKLLAITFCLFVLVSQTSAVVARNRTVKAQPNNTTNTQEVNSSKDSAVGIDLVSLCLSAISVIGTFFMDIVVSAYGMIQNFSDMNVSAKVLFTVGLIIVIAKLTSKKENKTDILAKQMLDLSQKVDKLLNKSAVEDITKTADIMSIKEQLDLLTENFSKTEGNIKTQATTQQKTEEFISKFTQEMINSQATMLKELNSLKKTVSKPAAQTIQISAKRDLKSQVAPQSAVHVDTSATTPLYSGNLTPGPVSAARKPSAFCKVSTTKKGFSFKESQADNSASPVSISMPFGAAGKPLSEILSPAKGLKNPFEASKVIGNRQKENLLPN